MCCEDKNARQYLTFSNIVIKIPNPAHKDNTTISDYPNYSGHGSHYSVLSTFFSNQMRLDRKIFYALLLKILSIKYFNIL